jgi:hypothetical protein
MSLIKKKDVKLYFSDRQRKGLHLVKPVSKSPAAGPLVTDLSTEGNMPVFVDDFSLEHSSSGGAVSAVVMVTPCDDSQAPEVPSSPQS